MKDKINTHRVVTFLTRHELEFLDKLEKDMMFSTGMHISRSKIIEGIVELLSKTHMDASGIKDNHQLEQRMAEAITRIAWAEARNDKEAAPAKLSGSQH